MSEDFLKRWSRRKREAAVETPAPARDQKAAAKPADHEAEAEFDPTSLPPIESITALTDVTAFLRKGVPAELTRAALRRVWTTDPAIRDFVGLAENAWDFTDPNAMPGFGPLESTDEVRRMIAQVVQQIGDAARPQEQAAEPAGGTSSNSSAVVDAAADAEDSEADAPSRRADETPSEPPADQVLLQSNRENTASQHDPAEGLAEPTQLLRRTHGGALPR